MRKRSNRPYVTLKLAVSADGMIAAQGILKPDESIAVVLSGVRHPAAPLPPTEETR